MYSTNGSCWYKWLYMWVFWCGKSWKIQNWLWCYLPVGTWELVIWTKWVWSSPFPWCCVVLTIDSIEANVVVIASCIPTLQPLLDYLVRKTKSSSYNNKYFNRLEKDGSKIICSQSIEMRTHRTNRTMQNSITNIERGDNSQENILSPPDGQNQILRTDNVTVKYESRADEASRTGDW